MTSGLKDKRILVGVCGSIAAYKACDLVRRLRKEGADVTVAMTEAATQFVGPTTFAAFTTHPVLVHQFPTDPEQGVPHVEIAEAFDLMVVAPATADILGKAAHAIADDLLSTILNIIDVPILFVPAMNFRMWRNPATQDAVSRLRGWGRRILDPDEGDLATLHVGVGRFPETESILSEIRGMLDIPQLLAGKRVLVTAGPTREPVDPVRFLSNRSSGKMGYALAAAARDFGAEVTLISGPVALDPVPGCRMVPGTTAEEMLAAVMHECGSQDMLIMAAAVADFQPDQARDKKISRSSKPTALSLKPTPDIIKAVRKEYDGTLVAFSLQAGSDLEPARKKLLDKKADYMVVNRYDESGMGFETDMNHVWVLSAAGTEQEIPPDNKLSIAKQILEIIAQDIPQ
ncbi:MAG: bifunctional phosphopantothenoylcysteine decarboxylase/phosphopantothenate--cysteine ligase CoaBC [Fidelibacterota bacterium]|nr:MAG: bifunctional phosphopantothenoylcysteine decarboxylase/phosphopantothenate--cysteine ligase CoaBC [Candidatus Neomarinimicrobiota bacterium]